MNLIPVIVRVERQRESVDRLVEYCRRLDGTELMVVDKRDDPSPAYPKNAFHSAQAYALHQAAEEVGDSFIWVEHDSIPLKPGWVEILSCEYERCGQKFLLSSDTNPPHDRVGGIGCYPEETEWLVPFHFEKSSWDLWLIECVPHLVARTPLIQHSYCIYGSDGFCREEHRFPRDRAILREEAVIFHRDPFQDIISHAALSFATG